jgi:translocation and assembly module TamB
VHGPFTKPDASATLVAEGLVLGAASTGQANPGQPPTGQPPTGEASASQGDIGQGTVVQGEIGRITAKLQGSAGSLTLDGTVDGIGLPGPKPDALAAAPLQVSASMRLDTADRKLTFSLRHPLFTIDGTATTAGEQHGEMHLIVPEIAPLAAAGGIDVGGSAALTLRADRLGEDTRVAAQGTFEVTNGPGPATTLLGQDTNLDVLATLHGQTVRLTRLNIGSDAFSVGASGTVAPGALDLDWRAAVADLAKVNPNVTGPFQATGKISGSPADLTVTSDLTGKVGAAGIAPGTVSAQVTLTGLPNAPAGRISAHGMLLGAPLELAVAAARENGKVRVAIQQASWKSVHAEGTLLTDPAALRDATALGDSAALLPQGQVAFAMTRLDDLQPLLGVALGGAALRGSVSGKLDSTNAGASLTVTARDAELTGTATVARVALDAKVADPMAHPTLTGRLTLDGIVADGVAGSARIDATGPPDALALRLAATLPALAGAPASIDAAGTVNTAARTATIASLQANWEPAPIRLLAPARISFADGLSVERLRIGLRQAVLEADGRISPTLDVTARLRGMPASLATLASLGASSGAVPGATSASGARPGSALTLDGTLDADARLTGTPARPGGTVRVTARGLRPTSGPARALPAADVTATATLQGDAARIDLRAKAGSTQITLTGTAPLSASGVFDLHATGAVDLAVTDPLLTPGGQRARGRASLDATVTGTPTAPRLTGVVQLADASFRDFAHGIDIEAINASLVADGGTVQLARFAAKAGPGTIGATGSLDLTTPGRPLDLTLTARNVRPLASDLLTANLDADLTLRGDLGGDLGGDLAGRLIAAGRVFVRHADIRVPESLPASVPVLNVRVAGAPPRPVVAPAAGPDVALDLTIDAPEQVFVRGRGMDAEVGGTVHLQGSAANPIPSGGFTLRRGNISMAGQTLTFSTGRVSFDGGSLTDPSLNFTSTQSTNNVTATLAITGLASKPKVTLSSSPSMPQDEVLSYLLFGQSAVSLGPLQIAEIAATLASLSGAGPVMSNPLDSLRVAAGLDRLGIASGSSLQAGRYIARNVYVGAQQSVTGTGTQAVVEVDLTKRLKLKATAGTSASSTPQSATGAGDSASGTSVGITYQFEY